MPNYNYLPNAKSDFPHVSNVDTYKYDNDFDYGRFDYTQMKLQLCTVPWDMGEAHIGNRTISGIGNVVYFGTKAKRDAWFDAIPDDECYRFSTKFKELHRDQIIDVPVPYDMCAKHNYLVVRYAKFANENSPVQYEGNDGLREWFWFVREVEFLAPNTTRLHLMDDAFQTWIYDVDVTGMVLERGHAPMFAVKADEYLSNPIGNNKYLLTEDVNFGETSIVRHIDALALNAGNMYACIATTAYLPGTWGTKADGTWKTPALSYNDSDGVPSVYVFAVAVANLDTFLTNVDASYPQFKQTVQGIFFASDDLITLGTSFTFATVACYPISAGRKTLEFIDLEKSEFAYPARYADLAKLYTNPYAHIEVTDENGNVDIVRIEDTDGTVNVSAALSLAYPFVNIEAHLMGVGGSASASVTFKNIDAKTFDISGRWYDTIKSWSVPTFAIVQESSVNYDYATDFQRKQRVVDYETAYDNATASNQTVYDNATANAATVNANANESANAITDNAVTATTANTAITTRSNQSAYDDLGYTQGYNTAVADADVLVTNVSASATIAAQDQQASIATASGAASAAIGTLSSAASLDLGGAVSSIGNGVIGAATTMANTEVGIHLTAAAASATNASTRAHATAANSKSQYQTDNQVNTATDITGYNNTMVSGIAATNAGAIIANASRTLATDNANATRTQTTDDANATRTQAQAVSSIENDVKQAALGEPRIYGSFADGDTATTKPIALFAHVVTQSDSAISSAGDEFLRYGYMFDKQWDFDGNWNIGKYFTYWKLRDFWVSNLNVPDMYMDRLRFFLFGGVTIWRKPEDIGKRTVYENFA